MLHGEGWRSGPGHLALEKTFSTFISVGASGPRMETDLVLRRLPMTPGHHENPSQDRFLL